ncbi:MAG: hypothetical protein JWR18_2642 [Segetibacter sp.]|nr:hypothetical protein [Segetibacter sp.]
MLVIKAVTKTLLGLSGNQHCFVIPIPVTEWQTGDEVK